MSRSARRARLIRSSLAAITAAATIALAGCSGGESRRNETCVLCSENVTCETVLVFWRFFGIGEGLIDPTDRRVAVLSLGDRLPLTLTGANVHDLDCRYQLVSVEWVSTDPHVVSIDESSETEVTLVAVGLGTSDIYADVVLADGSELRATDGEVRESGVTVTTIRVEEPSQDSRP